VRAASAVISAKIVVPNGRSLRAVDGLAATG
jgi:hypothetical protein